MNVSAFKPAVMAAVGLSALLALGACGKKVDDTTTPAPMTPSTTPSTSPSTTMPSTSPSMGSSDAPSSGSMGGSSAPGAMTPMAPASASSN